MTPAERATDVMRHIWPRTESDYLDENETRITIEKAIRASVEEEREACAVACENSYAGDEAVHDWPTPEQCADAIRARGGKEGT